jgi:hypothetical protein
MTFDMDPQRGDWISGHLFPSAGADNPYAQHPFVLAACPLTAMSYAWFPVAMVMSAIRRAARRRLEVRALERAFARTGQEAGRPRSGRRPAFFIASRRPVRPWPGE